MRIPKRIHYCWFGRNPMPDSVKKCIESWKKFCNDYEFILWNEENYNLNKTCSYVKEAYSKGKWAFVSDYVRFDVIYKYGGFYFDTDVEIIKSIDELANKGPFFGMERNCNRYEVQPGLGMGAEAGNAFYKDIIDNYKKDHFILDDGSINTNTVVDRATELMIKYGYDIHKNEIQTINHISIYPTEYFCPMDYDTGLISVTENTYSIHWYDMSWLTEKERKWQLFSRKHNGFPDRNILMLLVKEIYCKGIFSAVKSVCRKLRSYKK